MSKKFLSDEDKALFRQMMVAVKPLQKDKKADLSEQKIARELPRKPSAYPIEKPHTPSFYLSDYYVNEVQTQSQLSYCSHSIPTKRIRELKKGEIPWQARLDLHGLRPDAAKDALIHFIMQQQQLASRCLLIIHGKGSRQGEPPVLKNLVNHWLPQFPQVLAFHSAIARDGGNGALYVLLKRLREEKD